MPRENQDWSPVRDEAAEKKRAQRVLKSASPRQSEQDARKKERNS